MSSTSNMTEQQKDAIRNHYKNVDVDIERAGTKIILPNDPTSMTIDEGIDALQKRKKQEQTEVSIHEEVQAFPLEGAYAFMQALRRVYGWVNAVPTPGFFGPTPPAMVGVEIAPGKFEQVVWGDVQVPDIKGVLTTSATKRDGMPRFVIGGTVLQKYVGQVKKIAEITRQIVKEESIYRGNAVRLSANENGSVNFQNDLKFLDVSNVNEDELVFPDETMEQIEVNLFTPIENAEACRKHKIPLSRKVLFEGPFGVGKTITAYVAAKKATQRGWTFIYLDRVAGLKDALLFAKQYAPAVLFAEDIDRITTGDRDSKTDDVLNTIDGADTKGCEILTILTTNNVENIHQAMLRPGRLDAVISVRAPDAKAVQKLVRIYSRDRLPAGEDLSEVGKELAGQIPAVIREVVERSKLYAIGRANANGTDVQISGTDLARSARGMKMHLEFLNKPRNEPTLSERFTSTFVEVMNTTVPKTISEDTQPIKVNVTKLCQKMGVQPTM